MCSFQNNFESFEKIVIIESSRNDSILFINHWKEKFQVVEKLKNRTWVINIWLFIQYHNEDI